MCVSSVDISPMYAVGNFARTLLVRPDAAATVRILSRPPLAQCDRPVPPGTITFLYNSPDYPASSYKIFLLYYHGCFGCIPYNNALRKGCHIASVFTSVLITFPAAALAAFAAILARLFCLDDARLRFFGATAAAPDCVLLCIGFVCLDGPASISGMIGFFSSTMSKFGRGMIPLAVSISEGWRKLDVRGGGGKLASWTIHKAKYGVWVIFCECWCKEFTVLLGPFSPQTMPPILVRCGTSELSSKRLALRHVPQASYFVREQVRHRIPVSHLPFRSPCGCYEHGGSRFECTLDRDVHCLETRCRRHLSSISEGRACCEEL